jgi:hypothetical protein
MQIRLPFGSSRFAVGCLLAASAAVCTSVVIEVIAPSERLLMSRRELSSSPAAVVGAEPTSAPTAMKTEATNSELATALRALAAEKRAEISRRFPRPSMPAAAVFATDSAEIPSYPYLESLDNCRWPTEQRQAQLQKRALAKLPPRLADGDFTVAFGCEDLSGTIVSLRYDTRARGDGQDGIWATMRVSARDVERLAFYRGESTTDWMEYSNEVEQWPIAIADLDGDGEHDAVFVQSTKEGGARYGEDELSAWFSKSRRVLRLGNQIRSEGLWLPRGQNALAHGPIVIGLIGQEIGHRRGPKSYMCFDETGVLASCPGAHIAGQIEDIEEVLSWWESGVVTDIDRDTLAKHFETVGVDERVRVQLLPMAPATDPDVRLQRAVDDFVFTHPLWADTPPRHPALARALQQQDCPAMTAMQSANVVSAIRTWLKKHDVEAPACEYWSDASDEPQPCRWSAPRDFVVNASCVNGSQSYAAQTRAQPTSASQGAIRYRRQIQSRSMQRAATSYRRTRLPA